MISVIIPTYEMGGVGSNFLKKSLYYLSNQTLKDFEVVISDHSISNEIEEVCREYKNLDIKYIKNPNDIGSSSSNLNNGILNSGFDILKFLMQDEYIYDIDALKDIKFAFDNPSINWVATGCYYGNSPDHPLGKMIPIYTNDIIQGNNLIGSPSIISIRRTDDIEFFNPDLIWLMDCEYYKRLYDKWGSPHVIPKYSIFVNQHENQLTNILSKEIKQYEHQILKNKYHK